MKSALILEDHSDVRLWMVSMLQKAFGDLHVVQASTVEQAMKKIQQEPFDLALIDYQLPDGCGVDVIREIVRMSSQTYNLLCDCHYF